MISSSARYVLRPQYEAEQTELALDDVKQNRLAAFHQPAGATQKTSWVTHTIAQRQLVKRPVTVRG